MDAFQKIDSADYLNKIHLHAELRVSFTRENSLGGNTIKANCRFFLKGKLLYMLYIIFSNPYKGNVSGDFLSHKMAPLRENILS